MKQCPKCNFSNQDVDTFCSNCGSSLEPVNQVNNYGTTPPTYPPMNTKTNGLAVASMVLGISSVPLLCCCYLGVIPAILAIIFGFIARNKLAMPANVEKGSGMALAGLILGFCAIGIALILLIIIFSGGFSMNSYWRDFQNGVQEGYKYE